METYTIEKALEHFDITNIEFYERLGSLEESFFEGEEDLLYFDGDGGCLWCKFSEMFVDSGFSIGTVGCFYCDVSFYALNKIGDFFRDLAKNIGVNHG